MRVETAAPNRNRADSFDEASQSRRARGRNDRVPIAPQKRHGRKTGELVRALVKGPALTAPVDDVTYGSRKGARRTLLRIHSAELFDVALGDDLTKGLQGEPRTRSHEGLAQS